MDELGHSLKCLLHVPWFSHGRVDPHKKVPRRCGVTMPQHYVGSIESWHHSHNPNAKGADKCVGW